ncbi:MAG: PEPxxWA-CTERM sorting domain-containing protein [Chakrabartia sp.]
MKKFAKSAMFALAGAAALASVPASAAELVIDGGFESGNLSAWTRSGNLGFTGVANGIGNGGTRGAFLGPIGAVGTLTQVLNTVAGQTYSISFDLRNQDPGTPNFFQVLFNGASIFSQTDAGGPVTYATNTFSRVATSAFTTLQINFAHDPDFYNLDNVSVQGVAGVPEPETWMMLLFGFGVAGFAMRRRNREVSAFA